MDYMREKSWLASASAAVAVAETRAARLQFFELRISMGDRGNMSMRLMFIFNKESLKFKDKECVAVAVARSSRT